MSARRNNPWRVALLTLWYAALVAMIFMLHDLPFREFRYWRM